MWNCVFFSLVEEILFLCPSDGAALLHYKVLGYNISHLSETKQAPQDKSPFLVFCVMWADTKKVNLISEVNFSC